MSSPIARVAGIVACSIALAACSGGPDTAVSDQAPAQSPSSSPRTEAPTATSTEPTPTPSAPASEPASDAVVVDVDVEDGVVSPVGDRISVDRGQVVELVVTSDVAGELHVHSSPESYEEFAAGSNAPIKLQFDRPGLIDIELSAPFEGPVVQLEVS